MCLDAPPAAFEAESAFWQAMAPGAWLPDADDTVRRPGGALAVALRLQRNQLGTGAGAHLHIGTDDLGAEVDRLVALGARTRLVRPRRTVLELSLIHI